MPNISETLTQQRLGSRSFNKNNLDSTHDSYNTDSCQRQKDNDREHDSFPLTVAAIAILTSCDGGEMSILELAAERERTKKEKLERRNYKGNLETLPSAKSVALAPQSHPLLAREIENRDRLSHWFHHGYDAIEKVGDGEWTTLPYLLLPGAIDEKWRDGDRAIGLGFGKETNYFVIDIDCGSKYHNEVAVGEINEVAVGEIKAALEVIGINKTVLIQSSFSTGFHLFGFLSESVPTFSLACALHYCLEDAGLEIQKGQLELFPNRKKFVGKGKSIYNRLRLPLQPGSGSFLLDGDFCPCSDSIEIFLNLADRAALNNDLETLLEACGTARNRYSEEKKQKRENNGPNGFLSLKKIGKTTNQWKRDGEAAIEKGWDAHHQSNDLLGHIAEYGRVFLGLGGVELVEYIYKTAITAPGYSTYCRHQEEIYSWCERWAKSAERHRYPYGTRKGGEFKRLGKGGPTNEEKKADAMRRVIEYVENFEGVWPTTIRDRRSLIAKGARCSEGTLAKAEYLPLWHPKYMSSEGECLTTTNTDSCTENGCDQTPAINWVIRLVPLQEREKLPLSAQSLGNCLSQHCAYYPRTPLTFQIPETIALQVLQPIELKNSRKSYHTQNAKIQSWRSRILLTTKRRE